MRLHMQVAICLSHKICKPPARSGQRLRLDVHLIRLIMSKFWSPARPAEMSLPAYNVYHDLELQLLEPLYMLPREGRMHMQVNIYLHVELRLPACTCNCCMSEVLKVLPQLPKGLLLHMHILQMNSANANLLTQYYQVLYLAQSATRPMHDR
jgi:hypothetical protein